MKRTRTMVAWKHTLPTVNKNIIEEVPSIADQLLDLEWEVVCNGINSLSPLRKSIYLARNVIREMLVNGELNQPEQEVI